MAYVIQGGREDPTLEYDVTDASTGAPMRVTVLSGVLALYYEQQGMFRVVMAGKEERQPMGFYVPGAAPVPPGPEPVIVAELSLSQVGVHISSVHGTWMHGVGDVVGQLLADPQRPGHRLPYLSFSAVGTDAMALRYRVTIYRSRG